MHLKELLLEAKNSKYSSQMKIIVSTDSEKYASISKKYGMLHQPVSTTKDVRGVFIIAPDNTMTTVDLCDAGGVTGVFFICLHLLLEAGLPTQLRQIKNHIVY